MPSAVPQIKIEEKINSKVALNVFGSCSKCQEGDSCANQQMTLLILNDFEIVVHFLALLCKVWNGK